MLEDERDVDHGYGSRNVVITPHLEWYNDARLLKDTFEILTAYKHGKMINQVA